MREVAAETFCNLQTGQPAVLAPARLDSTQHKPQSQPKAIPNTIIAGELVCSNIYAESSVLQASTTRIISCLQVLKCC